MPPPPGSGMGQPPMDYLAQDAVANLRGQHRSFTRPPEWEMRGYERAELTDEERAEAQKAADEAALTCQYCLGVHKNPTSIGCPRIAEAELDGDGKIRKVRFREDMKWASRVALVEDLEEAVDGGKH